VLSTFAGVLGFPVRHSRSPAMMNAAFAELGLDWRYTALPVPPANFAETVRALHASGYRAANVTIPHKLAALEAADELSDTARSIGAVNTLTLSGDGLIVGDNTDAGGLLDALGEPVPGSALVLGAGGAARAAAWALREAGSEVTIWNRTARRAETLARELGVGAGTADAELLVNATSVGMGSDDMPVPARELHADQVVADIVVHPLDTAFLRAARAAGALTVDGLGMLVHQAARAFTLWTGVAAPVGVMRQAARAAVEARA
jgi:shikimate dehydrogenase